MTTLTIVIGILLKLYLFIYSIVIITISNSITEHLRKQGIFAKSEANLAGMTNSNFWKENKSDVQTVSDPVTSRLFRIKHVLVLVGITIGVVFMIILLVH